MLTEKDYEELWKCQPNKKDSFATITKKALPLYNEYAFRENMFQDYLDIFRGKNTRDSRKLNPENHPFLDRKNNYLNGKDGKLLFDKKPCVKYVLVGEAAPEKKKVSDNKNEKDHIKLLTFIYNVHIERGGQYITSILNAFDKKLEIKKMDTKERLVEMARNGVILFDLFPFAFKYASTNRERLNEKGITEYFFKILFREN